MSGKKLFSSLLPEDFEIKSAAAPSTKLPIKFLQCGSEADMVPVENDGLSLSFPSVVALHQNKGFN